VKDTTGSFKRLVPAFLKRGALAGMFTVRKYLLGYRVPANPHLDEPGEITFREILYLRRGPLTLQADVLDDLAQRVLA
jgi:hypothetical protein